MKRAIIIPKYFSPFLKHSLFILLVFYNVFAYAQDISGIKFNRNLYNRLENTSLLLNEGNPIELSDSFNISFEISFWNPEYYGPIIRIDDEKGNELSLIYKNYNEKFYSSLLLINKPLNHQIQINLPENRIIRNKWLKFRLAFDKSKEIISLYIDNNFEGNISSDLKEINYFRIAFGLKDFNNPADHDVPGMCIRNILIAENYKEKYFWSLNPSNSTKDEISDCDLTLANPNWLYLDHQYWRKLTIINLHKKEKAFYGVAYDSLNSRLFIDAYDRLIIYYIDTGRDTIINYKRLHPGKYNDLFYNQEKQLLYSYKSGMGPVSIYDLKRNEWYVNDTSDNFEGHYYGGGKFSYPKCENLYSLGGYGYYSTKKDIFRYDFVKKNWIKIGLKKNDMTPRCAFAFTHGFKEGEYYIYGGVGNESGNQDLGFHNYYDLYLLSMNDSTISKVNLPEQSNFQYSDLQNGFLDKKDSSIYFISYKDNKIPANYLNKLDLSTGEVSQLGNKILTKEFVKLIFNQSTNEFISITHDSSNVDIYAIDYPVLNNLTNYIVSQPPRKQSNTLYVLVTIGIILIAPLSFWFYKKRVNKLFENKNNLSAKLPDIITENQTLRKSIKLFGGFHLYNNSGEDIINEFSPKLKETFLLIFLRSFNHHPLGISSEELSTIIWPDYSPANIKSNRGVTIHRIRKIVATIEGISLKFQNKLWTIGLSDGITCDYLNFQNLKNENKLKEKSDLVVTLYDIFNGGEFLSGISYEWLDSLKSSINSEIIGFLKQFFDFDGIKNEQENIVKLCDIILTFDTLDMEATRKKIKSLYDTGKIPLAKKAYNSFINEYQQLYDEKFPNSFEELIISK